MPTTITVTEERLAMLLRAAEEAHGAYEQTLGHRDDNWPTWYAAFIAKQAQQQEQPHEQA